MLVRALRLSFLPASALPYAYGVLLGAGDLDIAPFVIGLIMIATAHLSCNLVNDYADSRHGPDWRDVNYYGFFGGSKLVQWGVLSERWYLRTALGFAFVSAAGAVTLSLLLDLWYVPPAYFGAMLLGWSYSVGPFRLSYRRSGEVSLFLLFGPVTVSAGYVFQTAALPPTAVLVLSLPWGLLTAAILLANEVPDREDDVAAGKRNLVGLLPPRLAYVPFAVSCGAGLCVVVAARLLDLAGPLVLSTLVALVPIMAAVRIMKRHHSDKIRLLDSSRLALAAHFVVAVGLMADALW